MHVERTHQLGRTLAMQKVDQFTDGLVQRPLPAGITVTNARKTWNSNTLDFSFRVNRGFIGATIPGTMLVTDTTVVLDVVLPPMLLNFVSEDQIRQIISDQLDAMLRP